MNIKLVFGIGFIITAIGWLVFSGAAIPTLVLPQWWNTVILIQTEMWLTKFPIPACNAEGKLMGIVVVYVKRAEG